MSILNKVITGKVKRPLLCLLYGPEGAGKTTFGGNSIKPILVGAEEGADIAGPPRLPPCKTYEEFIAGIDALIKDKHDYETIVIDTIDSIEPLLWDKIKRETGVPSIELACGGYGKGYVKAAEEFLKLREKLNVLRNQKGMNVIILAHSQVYKFNDPVTGVEHDTYKLKLHKRATPVFVEWVDMVLFATDKLYVENKTGKEKVFGIGERVVYTAKRPAFEAKNRFGLPFEISLDYGELIAEVEKVYAEHGVVTRPTALIHAISERVLKLPDEKLQKRVVADVQSCGDNETKLQAILDRLIEIIGG